MENNQEEEIYNDMMDCIANIQVFFVQNLNISAILLELACNNNHEMIKEAISKIEDNEISNFILELLNRISSFANENKEYHDFIMQNAKFMVEMQQEREAFAGKIDEITEILLSNREEAEVKS